MHTFTYTYAGDGDPFSASVAAPDAAHAAKGLLANVEHAYGYEMEPEEREEFLVHCMTALAKGRSERRCFSTPESNFDVEYRHVVEPSTSVEVLPTVPYVPRTHANEHPQIEIPNWLLAGAFDDQSWHNDTGCRFLKGDGDPEKASNYPLVVVWVFERQASKRENQEAGRFCIERYDTPENYDGCEVDEVLYQGDDSEIAERIARFAVGDPIPATKP